MTADLIAISIFATASLVAVIWLCLDLAREKGGAAFEDGIASAWAIARTGIWRKEKDAVGRHSREVVELMCHQKGPRGGAKCRIAGQAGATTVKVSDRLQRACTLISIGHEQNSDGSVPPKGNDTPTVATADPEIVNLLATMSCRGVLDLMKQVRQAG